MIAVSAPTSTACRVLGLIVLIRRMLELRAGDRDRGRRPWKAKQMSGVGGIRQATASALKPGPGPGPGP